MTTYKNARGSVLKLKFNDDNTITGTFITAVASKECQQAIGTRKPVTGYITKNSIAFVVSYPECGAVVSLAGNIEDNKSLIDTTAIIVHSTAHIATEGPGARMISHDVFNKV